VLDSVVDRLSDCVIYLGCAVYFAGAGNVTLVGLSALAMASAFLVSYVKARAENVIDRCGVGYWQRAERIGVFLLAAYVGHVPAALWLLSIGPLFTVAARVRHAGASLAGSAPSTAAAGGLAIWRSPRGSIGYDVVMASHLAFVIVAPFVHAVFAGDTDPLGVLLGGTGG
jgi:phosphatidylglycerophosphate synthase